LIALAKARPGEINYGTSGTGSTNHFAAELFRAMAGVNIVRINYKGGGPLLNSLLGGEVQLSFGSAGSVMPHIKSGRLRALAVTSAQPSELLPGLPAVGATVAGYEAVAVYGMFAPAGTPAAIISRLNQEVVQMLKKADVKAKLLNLGVEVVGSSPEQFAAAIRSEMARMGKVIRDAGLKAD
jgi:tripartite-type tricarboxylate transporter receptor subunit TctC